MIELYKSLLQEFITFKSVSTNPEFQDGIEQTVNWLEQKFNENNFQTSVVRGYSNPIIVAHHIADPSFKTCLIYGHYDVQPAVQEEGWNADPFTLSEQNGRLVARGAIDNKGQVLVHIATIFELIKNKQLGYNIKFMIEGNEETGSPNLAKFMHENSELLKCDLVMISDGEITGKSPILELGFRGGFNSTLTIKTAKNDLHSGIYGGIAPSSADEAAKFISTLYDTNNLVTIPNFYDDVLPPDEQNVKFNLDEYKSITGAKTVLTAPGFDEYTSVGLRPSLQVTGLHAGYVGDGYRNSIPAKTVVKINFRLVKNQKAEAIAELYRNYIKQTLPEYVDWDLKIDDIHEGIKLDIKNEYVEKARTILRDSYHTEPLLKYSGGGLPIVTHFEDIFHVPQVLAPLANEDCNMHGANENFDIDLLNKALDFSHKFFQK